MHRQILTLAAMAIAAPALAQQQPPSVPAKWKVRADHGTPIVVADSQLGPNTGDTVRLVTMPPGWHVTTGPAVITYDPAWQAQGSYRVEMESFLFPGDRLEGFGLFVGGHDLDGAGRSYLYVLLRKDGAFLVKRREGGATETLIPWTKHAAVVPHTEGTAKNVLAVDVATDSVRIVVNDQQVAALDRATLVTDGQVGLRVNHALNVHVTRVDVTQR
jgi:hypothetical protein